MKIIVVDDELAALRTFLPNVLDDVRIECKMFMNDPLSALEYAKLTPVDVAFLDVAMPKLGGVELAEKLIACNPSIKIVFISGYVQDEAAIAARLAENYAGCCYKPYDGEQLKAMLSTFASEKPTLRLKMFDAFDLFVNGRAVRFSSSKSKELLALLADAGGSYVTMDTAICNLWEDKNAELAKRLYRDAVCRLRLTLKEAGAEGLVRFERGRAVLERSMASCDLWDFLEGRGDFTGRYLPQYGWSVITEMALEKKSENIPSPQGG